MLKNSLFGFGVLFLVLCGCMPAVKYAGSEYQDSNGGIDRLQRDMDTRILNSISPTEKPFDTRALVVLPSRVSIDAESRIRIPLASSAARRGNASAFDDLSPSFHLSVMKTKHSLKPNRDTTNPIIDLLILALNDARERDFQLTIEALRLRKIFKETYVARSDSSETSSLPKCEVNICFYADMTKHETIKVGDSSQEDIYEEKPTEELPGIKKPSGTAVDSEYAANPWDVTEAKRRTALLAWLDQLEKTAGRHLKK